MTLFYSSPNHFRHTIGRTKIYPNIASPIKSNSFLLIVKCISFVSRCAQLQLKIATFRLLTASLHRAFRSTGCASPYESYWSASISTFQSSLFRCKVVSEEVQFEIVPSVVSRTALLLCFFIVGIHASGISIPLSLLMLSGCVDSFLDPAGVPVWVSIL